jgi:peroxiredoxin/predicted 2-oxoglutarate/Fe(II)-dependent dioxygenase YbiX
MPKYRNLGVGEPASWFEARASTRDVFALDSVGGRYIVLCFYGTADTKGRAALDVAFAHPQLFDDQRTTFFGVSIDPADEAKRRVVGRVPGYRFFWDFNGAISRRYGAIPHDAEPGKGNVPLRRIWVVLDPTLRVLKLLPFRQDGSEASELMQYLAALPPPGLFAGFEVQAPVLVLPNVFEPEFCAKLIDLYEKSGGEETGFMRDVGGKTVQLHDYGHKRRRDHIIEDNEVIRQVLRRFNRAVNPELAKAYQYKATQMERFLVGCYRAEDSGHFAPHRDNTTKGTAHRRFAASVNLNAEFEGGEVSFPEYGSRGFKPPPGGAVVFSCSLLHAVAKVTRGARYAFLPFLYDEEAAKIRESNHAFLAQERGGEALGEPNAGD